MRELKRCDGQKYPAVISEQSKKNRILRKLSVGGGIYHMMAENFKKYIKEKYLILENNELQAT